MIRATNTGRLGIMIGDGNRTPPSPAPAAYFRKLSELGPSVGLDVFVFSPLEADWSRRRTTGYRWRPDRGEWEKASVPFPDVVYDRSFYKSRNAHAEHQQAARRLLRESGVVLLGHQLTGKRDVIAVLSQDPELAAHLPPTEPLDDPQQVAERLKQTPAVLLKPENGSCGRGVLCIRPTAGAGYELRGRNARNRIVCVEVHDRRSLVVAIRDWARRRPFLMQPFLLLETADGRPFDLRVLVQKDGRGRWRISGIAARIGRPGGVTSNLHGGGIATSGAALLGKEFGTSAETLLGRLRFLAVRTAVALESGFGRLAELGLDFGIDRSARIWLLEANSKPGHSAFVRLAGTGADAGADVEIGAKGGDGAPEPWLRPIFYARTLIDRLQGEETR